VNSRIITEATIQFGMDNYTELFGRSTIDGKLVGESVLQVMRADRTADE
jgi:triosephosphate isomerase